MIIAIRQTMENNRARDPRIIGPIEDLAAFEQWMYEQGDWVYWIGSTYYAEWTFIDTDEQSEWTSVEAFQGEIEDSQEQYG